MTASNRGRRPRRKQRDAGAKFHLTTVILVLYATILVGGTLMVVVTTVWTALSMLPFPLQAFLGFVLSVFVIAGGFTAAASIRDLRLMGRTI